MSTSAAERSRPKPRRRLFSISLRTLLVLVTVFAIWLGWRTTRAHKQRDAVARIRELGGVVSYDYEYSDDKGWISDAVPPGPRWMHDIAGVDFFATVVSVALWIPGGDRCTDDDLQCLTSLPRTKWLMIEGTSLVTNQGLEHLGSLAELRNLSLTDLSNVSDRGVAELTKLRKLESLIVERCNVTGVMLQSLSECPLSAITLNGCPIEDEQLVHLHEFSQLEILGLQDTPVTGAGLRHLGKLRHLRELDLSRTQVRDGLDHLTTLFELKQLQLGQTNLSRQDILQLARALPNCRISCDFGVYDPQQRAWSIELFQKP
jgi:hypothetical protein